MSIDSSELQADARREGLIVLNAVIRNRAPFPQDFPALELTLTDEARPPGAAPGALAARLPRRSARRRRYAQGIAPAAPKLPLRVYLDTGRTRATGYRLYLFYPS